MNGPNTTIKNPSNTSDSKTFTFDYSYWSFDGYKERSDGYFEPEDPKYADQQRVFNDLGQGVLENAWNGYNCSLFAYGQTGSGKSYSMVGYGANKGIVPIVSEKLFEQIDQKNGESGTEYQVSVSMLEIYCEKIRDLFDPQGAPKGGMKMREHPKKGFYVENLIQSPVDNYQAIQAKLDEGNKNRTIAATSMNATSSRAHTIFQISFAQKGEGGTTKTSIINLVDLAGSERQEDAKTEGDRLKEGIVINKSLSTLGRCIKALADKQKKKKVSVPYRDSVLTSLLKNALGGNSKTVMIAALSPADINYEETLSTLRFAERAKTIKTQAVVNESASDRLIRELREENQRLQEMLAAGGGGVAVAGGGAGDDAEVDELKRQLEENKREMENMEKSWQDRLSDEAGRPVVMMNRAEQDEKCKTTPHFWNLNEDPALSNVVVHFVTAGNSRIGSSKGNPTPEITLNGMGIQREHARLSNEDNNKILLTPMSGARILVNGKEISKERELLHNDRVHFGGNHLYVFAHPNNLKKREAANETIPTITYDWAQAEIAESLGIMGSRTGPRTKDDIILEDELVHLLPQVAQATAMANELKKNVSFETVLVAPQARGLKSGPTEINVKMINMENGNEFLWEKNKFINRYYGMQELYQNYMDGYSNWDVPKDRDPFYESPDKEVWIGNVHVYLQSLAYMVELDEQLPITDYKANERGHLQVEVVPCSIHGKELVGEYVDSPNELVGRPLNYKVKILSAMGLPRKFIASRCRYKFYGQESGNETEESTGNNPKYNNEKMFSFKPASQQLIDYLRDSALVIDVFGKQSDKKVKNAKLPMAPLAGAGGDYKAKAEKLEAKVDRVNLLVKEAEETGSKTVSIKALRKAVKDKDEEAEAAPVVNGVAEDDKSKKERRSSRVDSAKSREGSAKSRSGSAKSRDGSAKSRSGSAKSRSGSAKSRSGSAKSRDGSAKKERSKEDEKKRGKKEKGDHDKKPKESRNRSNSKSRSKGSRADA